MASSVEVVRQRIPSGGMASPSHYPIPPSAHRRFMAAGGLVGVPQFANQNRLVPVGFVGRHSWSSVSPHSSSLLTNRIQRLNLRVSAPTPGEEELCRHWMQNSAKYSKRYNVEKVSSNSKKVNKPNERPKTVQIPPARHSSVASFSRGDTPRNSPNSIENNNESRSPPRPPSARPSEARLRTRARASNTSPNTRNERSANSKGNSEIRRWSLSEAIMHQQDCKDDDSAYSSSREVTIHTDRAQTGSPGPPRSPPRSAPNLQSRDDSFHTLPGGRLSRARGQNSKVMVSGQDGRPVFYYHHNNQIPSDDCQLKRHNTQPEGHLLPLRRAGNIQQRPVTQPAMGTQHARKAYRRKVNSGPQLIRETMEEKLTQRALPANTNSAAENKKLRKIDESRSGSKNQYTSPNDYDAMNKQRTLLQKAQIPMKSNCQYIEPEVCERIVQWLLKVEQNPDLYYGFETDIFGDSIRTSESTKPANC